MRICLDARSLRLRPTGLGRYAAQLVSGLARLDQQNEYVIVRRPSHLGPIVEQENFREVFLPYDISSASNVLRGYRTINAVKADIYHSLFHFLPARVSAERVIITLHDLIWVDHPALADGRPLRRWIKSELGARGILRAVRAADHIVTASEATRQVAFAKHAVPAAKLTTIHHGVERCFFTAHRNGKPAVCEGPPFIFALGNNLPYKNIPRLVEAFALLAKSEPETRLLIAGRGEGQKELIELISRLDLDGRVQFLGQLTDDEVLACYAQALFFAFPSLVEGFGMPILEAMAGGCPVLTSRLSSPAEIAGDAAVLVDPADTSSIAAGMERLLNDEPLRRRLSADGRRRAAEFTWDRCAEQTLELYQGT